MNSFWAALAAVMAFLAGGLAHAASPLETEVRRLSQQAQGVVGVAATWEDGRPIVAAAADQRFPMASLFKVAVAAKALDMVDRRQLSLDRMIPIPPEAYVPSQVIADRLIHPGVSLSVANLLEVMITQSDNTAADILLQTVGGPTAVNAWLAGQGISEQRVDAGTAEILRAFFELPSGPFPTVLREAEARDPHLWRRADLVNPAYDDDPRNTTTPQAMAQLLQRIVGGRALSPESTGLLLDMMKRCRTGLGRIPALMPPGTTVAHKTGTMGATANDAGYVTLPDGRRIVLVVLVAKSAASLEARDRTIAEIARTVRDAAVLAER